MSGPLGAHAHASHGFLQRDQKMDYCEYNLAVKRACKESQIQNGTDCLHEKPIFQKNTPKWFLVDLRARKDYEVCTGF